MSNETPNYESRDVLETLSRIRARVQRLREVKAAGHQLHHNDEAELKGDVHAVIEYWARLVSMDGDYQAPALLSIGAASLIKMGAIDV